MNKTLKTKLYFILTGTVLLILGGFALQAHASSIDKQNVYDNATLTLYELETQQEELQDRISLAQTAKKEAESDLAKEKLEEATEAEDWPEVDRLTQKLLGLMKE